MQAATWARLEKYRGHIASQKAIDAPYHRRHYGSAYIYRGLALVKKRDYDGAISDFSEAVTRDPSVAFLAFNDRANVYEITGEYDKAIGDYGRAIQRDPGYAAAYFNRASLTRGGYDEAITDFDHAIGLRPNYAKAYGNRAIAYQMKGKIDPPQLKPAFPG
jgi:tetratricopeptide (TPR) repeat protein